jgi:sulfur carrier protein ThiS
MTGDDAAGPDDTPRSADGPLQAFVGVASPVGLGHVRLQGFGPLRGILPPTVEWDGGTVAGLLAVLGREAPDARRWLSGTAIVVDGQQVSAGDAVPVGSRVQLLPPVSGG